ncbi:23S rRNA (uracil(1939)-C(5))-methyltransferase RlmD [Listeria costaricensis]|uniref:23S rRNA (uracil(1939)-C(5))-methyltransferase RlmD n=1 Tax=Listeria costaricensis TaxID=2026604 RepID=UPI000C0847F8|nr:23S rRNA (uracil(1939)-C(5))-methyltransferase RlmD [Listeria costaricensis]
MAHAVEKNQEIELSVIDLTHEGSGVAKIDGYPLFIPNTLPGERVKIKVVKAGKKFGYGRLVELLEASPDRVEPPCPVYQKCGGCQLQHLSYAGQLRFKQKQVYEVMRRIGKQSVAVHETLGMAEPFYYRNKSQVPVGYVDGKLAAGFYQKRSHQIIDMDACLIQNKQNDAAVQATRKILAEYGLEPYDEERNRGDIRHIMTRSSYTNQELMLVLVTRKAQFPYKEVILERLQAEIPQLVSIVQNVNPDKTNVIFGKKTIVLWGKEAIVDTIHGIEFKISARSFYQVNPVQTERLYQEALDRAGLTGEETVIDAYCGIGSISLCLAKQAKHVYGVEIVPEAIEDARKNAAHNEMDNVTFEVGKAEEVIPKWYQEGVVADVLVVDPPRKGCDEQLLATILKMQPKRVVYVSCNPATLARDMQILTDGGYAAEDVQPVDMFPMTTHVETVVLMSRVEG